jgi:hypothetical protein
MARSNDSTWLTETEAADLLGLSQPTLNVRRRRVQNGDGDVWQDVPPFYDYEGEQGVRYRRRDVLEFRYRHRVGGSGEAA